MRIHSPSPHKLAQSKSSDYFFNYFTLGMVSTQFFFHFLCCILPRIIISKDKWSIKEDRILQMNSWHRRDKQLRKAEESFNHFFAQTMCHEKDWRWRNTSWSLHALGNFPLRFSPNLVWSHCLSTMISGLTDFHVFAVGHLIWCLQSFGEEVHSAHKLSWTLQLQHVSDDNI